MFSFASAVWNVCSLFISAGAVFLTFPKYVPGFVLHLYVYGKIRASKFIDPKQTSLLFPKSFFSHFYFSGILVITSCFVTSLYVTCGGGEWPSIFQSVVGVFRYPIIPAKESYGSMTSNLIVLACANIQVVRRFYETQCISVYSPGGKMSLAIYIIGVGFYAALPLTSLSGTDLTEKFVCNDFLQNLRWYHIAGVILFMVASFEQRNVAIQFAKLRQNKKGSVENTRHHIPRGRLFEYVSCPHYFMEILIYFAFSFIFAFQNTMMVCLTTFVFVNQLISGYFTHRWYKENFPKYPKQRTSTIPFLV